MKCLSLNLWNINPPLESRMNSLQSFIMNETPDVICFQEVSFFNGKLQISDICEKNGYYLFYKKSDSWKGREEGLAIAAKTKIERTSVYYLPNTHSFNDMQRLLINCQVSIDNQPVSIYNTHLAYHLKSKQTRLLQNRFITEVIYNDFQLNPNIIICGDFNCFKNEQTICSILYDKKINMINSKCLPEELYSFDKRNPYCSNDLWPNRNIDFIIHTNNGIFRKKLCMTNEDGYFPCSDHYGVIIEGEFYDAK